MTSLPAGQFNDEALAELADLLGSLQEKHYSAPLSSRSSPVGAHVRHIIEFYQCLLQGLETGRVDYDKRPRNEALESSSKLAMQHLESIRRELAQLDGTAAGMIITVSACTGHQQDHILTQSNLSRELLFLQSHTMHHLAVIALLLESCGETIPDDLGIATSTRVYRQNQKVVPG